MDSNILSSVYGLVIANSDLHSLSNALKQSSSRSSPRQIVTELSTYYICVKRGPGMNVFVLASVVLSIRYSSKTTSTFRLQMFLTTVNLSPVIRTGLHSFI